MKNLRNISIVVALVAVAMFSGYRLGLNQIRVGGGDQNKLDLGLMWQVKDKLEKKYLDKDKLEDKNMVYGAISGLVSSLGDPYTVFLPPKENKSSNEDLAGEFGGVGIQLGYKEKTLAVMTPLSNTPAEKAGIKAGDLILKINDEDTVGISLNEAVEKIRGKVGTEVTLELFREGEKETFKKILKREIIVVPSLEIEFVKKNGKEVAWIKLSKFSEQLYDDWPEVVEKIKSKNVKNIVLDLRNNPGGFLQGSVLVASDFLKTGEVVVSQANADGSEQKYRVERGMGNLLTEKLVVLINGGSASASEILAGALQELKRAKLVGEKSFGKGTVQTPEDFPDGSGLHITIAKWLLPSGKNIHGEGVTPDVEVKEEKDQLNKAIEVLLTN